MVPELLPGGMLLQSANLSDYKMVDIWSLGMTLFCTLHPDLGSSFLIELSETGFDVHRNISESLSEIILKNKRPKSSTKYQNTLINCWLNMWFALNQCLKFNPCERTSLDNFLRTLTNNIVPYVKNLPISQVSVAECVDAEIAAGKNSEVPSNESTDSCTFLSLKSMIELLKRKKLETIKIQDLLEEIAVETILKYPDQYRDMSSQHHPYEDFEIKKKQDPFLDLFDLKYY